MEGDFNEIVSQEDKQGGKRKGKGLFNPVRALIREMEIREVAFRGRRWTWENNRQGEGFIEQRLDMFFG